ncbi:DNA damage-induced apoptosis suppressor protein [Pelobates fuscus]|uniref:DNA damage-induced apoptosis suppressor protein n=1 Tax=Pelobates fuscus TaxID=191477 RepID=UPI002FE4C7C8
MDGKRTFLIATVLSVQDSSFTYPACHNCFSRVIHTHSRYNCPRCGYSSKETSQRYKLCLKVAEGHKLHIITAFGRCLDHIFGISANSLQQHLQDSIQISSKLESDRAPDLFYKAVEYCFIGRSFLFGVKIPANHCDKDQGCRLSSYGSVQHMFACQICLPNGDPIGCTVIQHYDYLLQCFLSGQQSINSASSPSSNNNQSLDLSCPSASNYDLCPDETQQRLDFWQKSLGLTSVASASVASTTAEPSTWELSRNKRKSFAHFSSDTGDHFNRASHSFQEEIKSDTFNISNTSTPKSRCASQDANIAPLVSKTHRNIIECSPFLCTLRSTDSPSTSKTAYKEENVGRMLSWNSVNCTSQVISLCSVDLSSKKSNTAGTHQEETEIWEDFLFSESLSEFIAKVEKEDAECQLSFSACKQNLNTLTNSSPIRHCGISTNNGSNTIVNEKIPFTSSNLSNLSKKDESFSFVLKPRCPIAAQQSNFLGQEDKLYSPVRDHLSIATKENWLTQALFFNPNGKTSLTRGKKFNRNSFGLSIQHGRDIQLNCTQLWDSDSTEHPLEASDEKYSTSADLFETREKIDDTTVRGTPVACHNFVDRGFDGKIKETCFPVNVVTAADEDLTQTDVFVPCLQSTPLVKRISGSHLLGINKKPLNVLSANKTGLIFSLRGISRCSLRNDLLKKMSQTSFLESTGNSILFCTVSRSSLALKSPALGTFISHSDEYSTRPLKQILPVSQVLNQETPRAGPSFHRRTHTAFKAAKMKFPSVDKENTNDQKDLFSNVIKSAFEKNNYKTVRNNEINGFLNNSLDLSPINCLPFPVVEGTEPNPFPNDWSPELFAEKSNTCRQEESLQRRLF